MEVITSTDGCIIPTSQILEIRDQGGEYLVKTIVRTYSVSADQVQSLITKPPKRVTKGKAAAA